MRAPLVLALAALAACSSSSSSDFDAGADFSLPTQLVRVSPATGVCCLAARGADFAAYLANASQGAIDADGREHPAHGDLHLTNPYGQDYLLGPNVPAGGYAFTPDGLFLLYMSPAGAAGQYALNAAPLSRPDLAMPSSITIVPRGLDDLPLLQQGFFSPSGRYFIVGVLPKNVANIPDLHIIDVQRANDFYTLDKGAFAYFELITPDDTMIYENSTASTVAGQPSVQGLYLLKLAAALSGSAGANGGAPSLLDTHTVNVSLMADGHTILYTRTNGQLMLYDLRDRSFLPIASNVASFASGPTAKGPIAYIAKDRSVHVMPRFQQEVAATAPGSADILGPLRFSPDATLVYYYSRLSSQDGYGVLYALRLGGSAPPILIGNRVSVGDTSYVNGRMVFIDEVDAIGVAGNLYAAAYDGSGRQLMAVHAALGELQLAQPVPPTPPKKLGRGTGPVDLAPALTPPVFANLTNATRDGSKRPIHGGRPITGALSFGPMIGQPEGVVNAQVPSAGFQFSDDNYLIAYLGDAAWSDASHQYVGNLSFLATLPGLYPTPNLQLGGVSEMGPIVGRQFFVAAPEQCGGATTPCTSSPGVYFVAY